MDKIMHRQYADDMYTTVLPDIKLKIVRPKISYLFKMEELVFDIDKSKSDVNNRKLFFKKQI